MRLLLLLFLPMVALGQGFGTFSHDQPFLAKEAAESLPYPQTVSGVYYYWNSTDLTVGDAVSSWASRVNSYAVTMSNAAQQPTNSSLGVWFSGTKVLTNQTGTLSQASPGSGLTFWAVINKSSWTEASRKTMFNIWGAEYDGFWVENSFLGLRAANMGKNGSGSGFRDFLYEDATGFTGRAYTNNVQTSTTSDIGSWTGFTFGNGSPGTLPLDGYIREFAVFTNVLDSATRSNLHYYATNSYTYSP